MNTCTTCHRRSLDTRVIRTDLTPSGVEIGMCRECDLMKCSKCKTPMEAFDRQCRACGKYP